MGLIDYGQSKQLPDDARIAFAKLIVAMDKEDKQVGQDTTSPEHSHRCDLIACNGQGAGRAANSQSLHALRKSHLFVLGTFLSAVKVGRIEVQLQTVRGRLSTARCGRWASSPSATMRSSAPRWHTACSTRVAGADSHPAYGCHHVPADLVCCDES